MKLMLFIFLLLNVASALASNLVFLTSLPKKDKYLERKLERKFLSYTSDFSHEFKRVVHHQADQELLYKYLNDPETHGVFWLSHGGFLRSSSRTALKPAPMLFDFRGDNVAKTFKKIHPNVKFLSIIGCNSKQIMEGIIPHREDLHYYIPGKRVTAVRGTKVATRVFRYFYHRTQVVKLDHDINELGYPIKVTRTTTSEFPEYRSLRVMVGNKLVSMLPKLKANSVAEYTLFVPFQQNYSRTDLKIVFDSGQNPFDSTDYIGQLEVAYDHQSLWRLFSKPNGEPFGVNERIFIFKGQQNIFTQARYYTLFKTERTQ